MVAALKYVSVWFAELFGWLPDIDASTVTTFLQCPFRKTAKRSKFKEGDRDESLENMIAAFAAMRAMSGGVVLYAGPNVKVTIKRGHDAYTRPEELEQLVSFIYFFVVSHDPPIGAKVVIGDVFKSASHHARFRANAGRVTEMLSASRDVESVTNAGALLAIAVYDTVAEEAQDVAYGVTLSFLSIADLERKDRETRTDFFQAIRSKQPQNVTAVIRQHWKRAEQTKEPFREN